MVAGNAWVCGSRNQKLLAHSLADQEEEMSVCAQLTSPLPLCVYWGNQAHGMGLPIFRMGLLVLP